MCYEVFLTFAINDCFLLLFFSGLKNDHIPETFPLKNEIDGNHFPCKYLKIGKCLQ